MRKDHEYSIRNLEIGSDIIARKCKARDRYLLGQPFYMDMMRYIVDILRVLLPEKARLLEVSCGTGILAELLLKELPNIRLDVTDVSGETLNVVKQRTRKYITRIGFIKKNNASYSFTGKYDAICTTNAMRLTFLDYKRLYGNFHKILKRKGIILIGEAIVPMGKSRILKRIGSAVNDAMSKPNTYKNWRRFVSKEFEGKVDRQDIEKVVKFYSPEFHIRKLKQAGFREVGIIYQKYHHVIIGGLKGLLIIKE